MNLKGKTYVLCLGTFACRLGRELQRIVGDGIHIWMMDGKSDADIPLLKAILKSYPNVDLKYLLSE